MVVKMITSKNGTKYLNSLNGNRFLVGVFTSFITVPVNLTVYKLPVHKIA